MYRRDAGAADAQLCCARCFFCCKKNSGTKKRIGEKYFRRCVFSVQSAAPASCGAKLMCDQTARSTVISGSISSRRIRSMPSLIVI